MVLPTLVNILFAEAKTELASGFLSTLSVGKQTQRNEFGSPKCSPYFSTIPAKGMWFCLIRDHEWAHGKPPIFNYWSPWLLGLSLAGWGSMLQGPSHSAMLPEVTRASWFSDWVCVCICVCAKSNILLTLSRLFSVDGVLQACSKHIFKIFVNLNGFKYLRNQTWKVDYQISREAEKLCEPLQDYLNERFHMNLQIFSNVFF